MSIEKLPVAPYETIPCDGDFKLRALRPNDAEEVFNLVDANREYVGRYMPWVKGTTEVANSANFIAQTIIERQEGKSYVFAIVQDDSIVGHVSLMHVKGDDRPPEVGYWLAEDKAGQGIVTQAAKAVTEFGRYELGLPRIILRAVPENTGSNRVAEKLGYTRAGQKPDENGRVHNIWTYRFNEFSETLQDTIWHSKADTALLVYRMVEGEEIELTMDGSLGATELEEDRTIRAICVNAKTGELKVVDDTSTGDRLADTNVCLGSYVFSVGNIQPVQGGLLRGFIGFRQGVAIDRNGSHFADGEPEYLIAEYSSLKLEGQEIF